MLLTELSIDLSYSLCSDGYFTSPVNFVTMSTLPPGSLWMTDHMQGLLHISSEGLKQSRYPSPSWVTLLCLYHSSASQHRQELGSDTFVGTGSGPDRSPDPLLFAGCCLAHGSQSSRKTKLSIPSFAESAAGDNY